MSVIAFNEKYIDELTGNLYACDEVFRYLEYDKNYTHYERFYKKFEKEFDEEKFKKDFIGRLMWYVFVANQVAHALQYRENPVFFDKDKSEPTGMQLPEKHKPISRLLSDLQHVRYNLNTNDGNMFLEQKWYDVFDGIIDHLQRKEHERLSRLERGEV